MRSCPLYCALLLALGACAASPTGVRGDAGSGLPPGDGEARPPVDAGGVDGNDAPSRDPLTMCGIISETASAEDWESCYQRQFCELAVNCGSMNLLSGVDECVRLAGTGQVALEARERSRAIAAQRAAIDRDAFTRCLLDMDPKQCLNPAFSISCATRYHGTVDDLQSCHDDIECASPGASCSPGACGDACCPGVCTPRLKPGERCITSDECGPGLRCSLGGSCVSGDVDAPCADSGDCDPNNWCDRLAGVCRSDLPEGGACSLLTQCGGETSCVGRARRVEPATCRRVNHEGDACDYVCLGNLYCDLSNPEGFGVCRSLPTHGEGCGPFLPCIGKTEICERGTCVARPLAGQPCVEGVCDPELFCSASPDLATPTCQPPRIAGQMCNQPDQCQSYICSNNDDATGMCMPWLDTCP